MTFCIKCGNPVGDADVFCTKCGATQSPQNGAAQTPPAPPQPQYGPPQQGFAPPPQGYGPQPQGYAPPPQGYGPTQGYPPQYGVPYGPYAPQYAPRKGSTLWQRVRQMDGEKLVKTFSCHRLKSLLLWNYDADGFLSVTDRRVLFWTEDRKPGERTVLQQEMPLKDVAGVSFHKGRIFSWLHFVLMVLFNLLIGTFATVILTLLALASPLAAKIIALIMGFGCMGGAVAHYAVNKKLTHALIPSLAYLSLFGFTMASGIGSSLGVLSFIAGPSLNGTGGGDAIAWAIFGVITLVLYMFAMIMYAVRPSFSLRLGSRAGGNGVKVAGLRLFNMGALMSKAVSAEPAEESEVLAGQLGAMIAELQENGEAAFEKWSK